MKALLVREVPRRNARTLRRIALALGIVAVVVGTANLVTAPHEMRTFDQSKSDIANTMVRKYVYEAYPSWRAVHHEPCPYRLDELNAYMNSTDIYDPWGVPYEMRCDDSGIVVHSLGEDRAYDTADDLWSFE